MLFKRAEATVDQVITTNKKTAAADVKEKTLMQFPEHLVFSPDNVYTIVRAISARINDNYDGFERAELLGNTTDADGEEHPEHNYRFGYNTFIGKPNHIDHFNEPHRAEEDPRHNPRGQILHATYHEAPFEDGYPQMKGVEDPIARYAGSDCWINLLIANNRNRWPELTAKLEGGEVTKVSMGCFVPGTPITLSDGTKKPIEEIAVGDEVMTHTGATENVTHTMTRPYHGVVYNVDTYGQRSPMCLTPEHPVWIRRDDSSRDSNNKKQIKRRKSEKCICGAHYPRGRGLMAHVWQKKKFGGEQYHAPVLPEPDDLYEDGWVNAEDLEPGDWVLTPTPQGAGHPGSYPFARLLGWYLAEGCTVWDDDGPKEVQWYVSAHPDNDEQEYADEIAMLVEALGYKISHRGTRDNTHGVRCISRELASRLHEYGGRYSWGKQLHPDVLHWSPENQRAMLEAFLLGDAHFRGECDERFFQIGVAAGKLMEQLYVIAARAGVTMTPVKSSTPEKALAVGRRAHHSATGRLEPTDGSSPEVGWDYKQGGQTRADERGVWRRIRKVRSMEYQGNVHNFDVNGDDSYVAQDIAVHNCEVICSECLVCGNRMRLPHEACSHISTYRGSRQYAEPGSPLVAWGMLEPGDPTIAAERNRGLQFIEESWITDEQADPSAVLQEIVRNEEPADKLSQKTAEPIQVNVTGPVNMERENSDPKDMDYSIPPNQQPGELEPEHNFPCSALVDLRRTKPDFPIDEEIDVAMCQGCMYNRTAAIGRVNCAFPEVVREGGGDPLPPGFSAEDEEQEASSGFLADDGTPIEMLPLRRRSVSTLNPDISWYKHY